VLRPTSTDAYCIFFSASLLVLVKIDRCLFFVTDFGIVCLDRLPFCWNDVTSLARAREYAKSGTNRRQRWLNWQHCRQFSRLCCWFVLTLAKVLIFVESGFDIRLVYRALCSRYVVSTVLTCGCHGYWEHCDVIEMCLLRYYLSDNRRRAMVHCT